MNLWLKTLPQKQKRKMFIEVYHREKLINRVMVDLPITGFTIKSYQLRTAIINLELEKLRKVYPYAEFILAFESKMNEG